MLVTIPMTPMPHQGKVQTLTPMLLDTILMILMDAKALNPLKVEKAPKMEKEGQVTSVTTIQLANVEALSLEMPVKVLDPVEAQGTWLMKTKFNSGKVPKTIAKALLELEDLVTLILMAAEDQQDMIQMILTHAEDLREDLKKDQEETLVSFWEMEEKDLAVAQEIMATNLALIPMILMVVKDLQVTILMIPIQPQEKDLGMIQTIQGMLGMIPTIPTVARDQELEELAQDMTLMTLTVARGLAMIPMIQTTAEIQDWIQMIPIMIPMIPTTARDQELEEVVLMTHQEKVPDSIQMIPAPENLVLDMIQTTQIIAKALILMLDQGKDPDMILTVPMLVTILTIPTVEKDPNSTPTILTLVTIPMTHMVVKALELEDLVTSILMTQIIAEALDLIPMTLTILEPWADPTTPMTQIVFQEKDLNMTLIIPMLVYQVLVMIQMTPMPHQGKVQALTPMLLDTILMILMDAKALLDMILMLHLEQVPTLIPTTLMLLDMIQMTPMPH